MRGNIEKRSKTSWTVVIEKGKDPVTGKRDRIYKAVKGPKREEKGYE